MQSTQSWPASSGTSVPVVQPAADQETAVSVVRVATPGVAARLGRAPIADEKSPRSPAFRSLNSSRASLWPPNTCLARCRWPLASGAASARAANPASSAGVAPSLSTCCFGWRDDPAELSGVSHFLEHLLFKGTATRSSQEISRSVDRVGGDFNAFTAKEYRLYYCRLPARHALFGVELLGDVLIRPALRESDVDSERLVILEELAMDDDSPDGVAPPTFRSQLFADHPLGRETAGDRDTVQAINADDVRKFFESHYHAGSMVVTLAGPISHDEALELISAAFVDVRSTGGVPVRTAPDSVGGDDSIDDDTEQVHIVMGCRALPGGDEHRGAAH